ncbi:MAG: PPA1309 family protein [Bowdeniella nasicola]|nr:PPA1309 family protein [Bowdeniella nasicola]
MSEQPTPRQWALRVAVSEIDTHVATGPWDGPIRVFSLVDTKAALTDDPVFARELPEQIRSEAEASPAHFTAVEQEGLPQVDTLEALLAQISWPPAVAGAVVVVERIVLPPQAEAELGAQASTAEYLAHPDRDDVRMCCGVLRSEEHWCVLRLRKSNEVVGGADLVPQLTSALLATFSP